MPSCKPWQGHLVVRKCQAVSLSRVLEEYDYARLSALATSLNSTTMPGLNLSFKEFDFARLSAFAMPFIITTMLGCRLCYALD